MSAATNAAAVTASKTPIIDFEGLQICSRVD
jgi:hypothetical protein